MYLNGIKLQTEKKHTCSFLHYTHLYHGLLLCPRITIIHFNDVYEMAGVLQDGSQAWTKPLTLLAGRIRAFDKDPPMKLEVKLTNSYDFGIFCLQVN